VNKLSKEVKFLAMFLPFYQTLRRHISDSSRRVKLRP